MKPIDENTLISQLRDPQTRAKAFEAVVAQYGQQIYWQIRRMVTYHDDADDVLQNTFVKAWANIDSFRGDSKLSTWLFRIAYNETLTFLKQQKDTVSLDTNVIDEDDDAPTLANTLQSDTYFDGDEAEALLFAALETLPPKQKAVFNMKYFEEKKYEEISEITGTSVGALKASYHLAVEKIEKYLAAHE